MKIRDLYGAGRRVFSFEFFPPRPTRGAATLERTIRELRDLRPGLRLGDLRRRRLHPRSDRRAGHPHPEAGRHHRHGPPHLRGRRPGRDRRRCSTAWSSGGIENVIALRGDPPAGQTQFQIPPDGFAHASDLVAFIRARLRRPALPGRRRLPRGPRRVPGSRRATCSTWRPRCGPGVDFIITQLFFDNRCYFDFVARARAAGITVPIVPGHHAHHQPGLDRADDHAVRRQHPARPDAELDRRRDDPAAVMQLGVAQAAAQCADLLARRAPRASTSTRSTSRPRRG